MGVLTVNECSECVNRVRCIYVSIDAKLGSVLYSGSSCQISRIAILEIYSILKNFVKLFSLAVTVGLFPKPKFFGVRIVSFESDCSGG